MNGKVEITLCMGSSCFARGNNRLLAELEAMIKRNDWGGLVVLAGSRCANRCGDGPNLMVDGETHRGLDASAIEEIVGEKLGRIKAVGASGERGRPA